ncbi:MAG: hypothetical protein AAF447_09735, partial [Myxococcota bacterium]
MSLRHPHRTAFVATAVTTAAAAAGIVATPAHHGPEAESAVLLAAGSALLLLRRPRFPRGGLALGLAAGAFALHLAWRAGLGSASEGAASVAGPAALSVVLTALAPLATALVALAAPRLRAHPAGPTTVACALALSVVALASSLAVDALRVRALGTPAAPALAAA